MTTLCPDISAATLEQPLLLSAMGATNDPDTLYYHEAMKAPDRQEFIKAMEKEIESQLQMGVYQLTRRDQVPEDATVLPADYLTKPMNKSTLESHRRFVQGW